MGNLRLYGSTSGYVEIAPPAVGSSQVLTLPTDSVQPGLVLVASQSFATASSVSINSCFSATYDNYLILIRCNSNSANANFYLRMRSGSSDYTTGNYQDQRFAVASTSTFPDRVAGQSQFRLGSVTTDGNFAAVDVFSPYVATNTGIEVHSGYYQSTPEMFLMCGSLTVANQFDGITVYPASGTMTAGTIKIYGYRN